MFKRLLINCFILSIILCIFAGYSVASDVNHAEISVSDVNDSSLTVNSNIIKEVSNNFTHYFDDTYNTSKIIECNGKTFEDIQKSINNANSGSYIHLNGNYIQNGNKSININKNLFIYGNSTLDAKNLSRIFDISDGQVTISGLNLINGMSNNGSAIYISNNINNNNDSIETNNTTSPLLISYMCTYKYNKCNNEYGHFIDSDKGTNTILVGDNRNIIDKSHCDIWELDQGKAVSFYKYDVSDFNSFKKLTELMNNHYYDYLIVNFKQGLNLSFKGSDIGIQDILRPKSTHVTINGNGASIKCTDNWSYRFKKILGHNFLCNDASDVRVMNLSVSGFCSAYVNYANLYLGSECIVKDNTNNHATYEVSDKFTPQTAGAALVNFGTCICNQTNFENNYGCVAGAISSTNSLVKIIDCTFKNNYKDKINGGVQFFSLDNSLLRLIDGDYYKKICDVYLSDSMLKVYSINKTMPSIRNSTIYRNTDGKSDEIVISRDSIYPLILFRNNTEDITLNITVNNTDDLKNINSICRDYTHYDQINLFFKKGNYLVNENYFNDKCIFKPLINIAIYGNDSTLSVENPKDNDNKHFLVNNLAFNNFCINNMTINGFNSAIINKGNGLCTFVNFTNNNINYYISEDYGGAIQNYGIISLTNCNFFNNSAKYGGAIYNTGFINFIGPATFQNNHAYICNETNKVWKWLNSVYRTIILNTDGDNSGDIHNNGKIEFNEINPIGIHSIDDKGTRTWVKWTMRVANIASIPLTVICPTFGTIFLSSSIVYDIGDAIHKYWSECDKSYGTLDSDNREGVEFRNKIIKNAVTVGIIIGVKFIERKMNTKFDNYKNQLNNQARNFNEKIRASREKLSEIDNELKNTLKEIVKDKRDMTPPELDNWIDSEYKLYNYNYILSNNNLNSIDGFIENYRAGIELYKLKMYKILDILRNNKMGKAVLNNYAKNLEECWNEINKICTNFKEIYNSIPLEQKMYYKNLKDMNLLKDEITVKWKKIDKIMNNVFDSYSWRLHIYTDKKFTQIFGLIHEITSSTSSVYNSISNIISNTYLGHLSNIYFGQSLIWSVSRLSNLCTYGSNIDNISSNAESNIFKKSDVNLNIENISTVKSTVKHIQVNVSSLGSPINEGIVNIIFNNQSYESYVNNGIAEFDLEIPKDIGNYMLKISYNENEFYNNASIISTINVKEDSYNINNIFDVKDYAGINETVSIYWNELKNVTGGIVDVICGKDIIKE